MINCQKIYTKIERQKALNEFLILSQKEWRNRGLRVRDRVRLEIMFQIVYSKK